MPTTACSARLPSFVRTARTASSWRVGSSPTAERARMRGGGAPGAGAPGPGHRARGRRRAAAAALAPEDGEGATDLVAAAERAVAPLERLAPELAGAGEALRQAELQLRETASELHRFLASLEAEPGRLEQVESELDVLADLKRRYRAQTLAELLERAAAAASELASFEEGHDPVRAAEDAVAAAETAVERAHAELRAARTTAATPFAEAVAEELRGVGLGEGEFRVELREREPGPSGAAEVVFLIRPNAGLPFGPVA